MEIDIDALEIAACAATPGPWTISEPVGETDTDYDPSYTIDLGAGGCIQQKLYYPSVPDRIEDARFIAAANPAVVLELIRRLKATEEKLAVLRPLTIGDVDGSATLYGTAEEVRAFHLKMREHSANGRRVAIEECIEIANGDHTADPFGGDTQLNTVSALRQFLASEGGDAPS